jgi:AcrR family transcriptional regulator
MQTKSFDEIAVQDITELATVNRATFYDHYTDKYALLEAMVAGGFHMLLHERNVIYDGTCPSAVSALILATCDYLTQNHGDGAECRRHSAFEPLTEAAVTAAIRRVLMAGMPKSDSALNPPPAMIATAASWAIYGAVKEWFSTPGRPAAEEVVPMIMQFVIPILKSGASKDAEPVSVHH